MNVTDVIFKAIHSNKKYANNIFYSSICCQQLLDLKWRQLIGNQKCNFELVNCSTRFQLSITFMNFLRRAENFHVLLSGLIGKKYPREVLLNVDRKHVNRQRIDEFTAVIETGSRFCSKDKNSFKCLWFSLHDVITDSADSGEIRTTGCRKLASWCCICFHRPSGLSGIDAHEEIIVDIVYIIFITTSNCPCSTFCSHGHRGRNSPSDIALDSCLGGWLFESKRFLLHNPSSTAVDSSFIKPPPRNVMDISQHKVMSTKSVHLQNGDSCIKKHAENVFWRPL